MKIKKITKLSNKYDRYDLTVGETSNFFANGVLIHNTSAIYANILCKKSFNPLRSMFNWVGGKLPTIEYKFVYSSRSVLKNRRDGKYTDDVWGVIAKELDGKIPSNYTLYGEIVGYTPSGKVIQKGYDYGVEVNKCEFWLYRVTYNLSNGEVYEFDWDDIERLAEELGIKHVPIYYQGFASELFDIPHDNDWHSNFLSKLKEKHLDKICELCTNGVVNEGIVLRNESKKSRPAFKFKSPKFLIKESEARDNNEEDMEDNS